jgi:hypothetical protein
MVNKVPVVNLTSLRFFKNSVGMMYTFYIFPYFEILDTG